ncbi:zinc finger protein [Trichosporon asahii var. asahii CBS 8904]|uniref:Zinc finger protein n=1 Tax=Trichosporon asahii var. asahii (strain CBS 8904) TaxID=1220162 RepID=K1VJ12_TRIAC|nr:zinc finger protein [Trichosporon asahii var. asahii CBS 8904]
MISIGPNAGATIAEFSRQFQYDFVTLLKSRHNTQRVRANAVYNEYIQDKHHVHMNATRWVTLNGFIQTIGKAGIVKVDEDDKGLWIQWVDTRPETLAKQKKDRATMDGEERERKMLEDQIARARALAAEQESSSPAPGLQKADGEKVKLSLGPISLGGSASPSASGASTPATGDEKEAKPMSISFGSGVSLSGAAPAANPLKMNPLKANPLKRPAPGNVFKSVKAAKTDEPEAKPKGFVSEAERLMREDQARKAARASGGGRGGYGGHGEPRR